MRRRPSSHRVGERAARSRLHPRRLLCNPTVYVFSLSLVFYAGQIEWYNLFSMIYWQISAVVAVDHDWIPFRRWVLSALELSLISVTARCNGLERWISLAVGSAVPCLRAGRDAVTRTSIVGVWAEGGNLGGCKRRYRRLALQYCCSSSMHGSSQQGHKDGGLEGRRH